MSFTHDNLKTGRPRMSEWLPLSDDLSEQLTLQNADMNSGQVIRISDCWVRDELPWLALSDQESASEAEFCVRWILQMSQGNFLLLEKSPHNFDIELDAPPQVLVKVVDKTAILTLTAKEFGALVPDLKSDIAKRRDWPAEKWREVFAVEVKSVLGAIENST